MEGEHKDGVNQNEILRDLTHDLAMADKDKPAGETPSSPLVSKPVVRLSPAVVRIAVNSKNRFAIKMLSKDLDEAGRDLVAKVYATQEGEAEAYGAAIEQLVQEHCSPEQIDWLNRLAGSPLAILVEIELEKYVKLRRELAIFLRQNKPSSANEGLRDAA